MHHSQVKLTAAAFLLIALMAASARAIEVSHLMLNDPLLDWRQIETSFPDELPELFALALNSPETAMQRQAATSIIVAQRAGMEGLAPLSRPLTALLGKPEAHPAVIRVAAQALVALEARDSADALMALRAGKTDLDLAEIIEPALARWNYQPMRPVWLERLEDPRQSTRLRILAAQSLAEVRDPRAVAPFKALAANPMTPPPLRLAVASALGRLVSESMATMAQTIWSTDRDKAVNQLVAIRLLQRDSGELSRELLARFAESPIGPAASSALQRLLEIDPQLVIPLVPELIGHTDANVRLPITRALVSTASVEHVATLGPMLDDTDPSVRRYVQQSLAELASKPELKDEVLRQSRNMLQTDRWRGLEQAILLSVALDDKTVAQRCVELLEFERPEVLVAAAWGLCELAVPETLPDIFMRASYVSRQSRTHRSALPEQVQLAHLFQAMGRMQYRRADDPNDGILRICIPKSAPFAGDTRAAAIWALGIIYHDDPQAKLTADFAERLSDDDEEVPEDLTVRAMSAVSLGRMKGQDGLPALRAWAGDASHHGFAASWALTQMTGQPMIERHLLIYPAAIRWFLRRTTNAPQTESEADASHLNQRATHADDQR